MVVLFDLLVKLWWFCVVAVVWVLLYRAAFPASWDEELAGPAEAPAAGPLGAALAVAPVGAGAGPPGPLIDSRPRTRCPRCGEMVLVEAALCRFCGYRSAAPVKP
jgi:hypothetical protein